MWLFLDNQINQFFLRPDDFGVVEKDLDELLDVTNNAGWEFGPRSDAVSAVSEMGGDRNPVIGPYDLRMTMIIREEDDFCLVDIDVYRGNVVFLLEEDLGFPNGKNLGHGNSFVLNLGCIC